MSKARKPRKRPTSAARKHDAARGNRARAKAAPRADLGQPIAGFVSGQPAQLRAILEELQQLIEEVAPDVQSSLKWGMPFYTLEGTMMCATSAHKSHVNLILSGPPEVFVDPEGRLSGEGKTGRHLKLTTVEELPRAAIRSWLQTAAALARAQRSRRS